jgi:hypothetical protein
VVFRFEAGSAEGDGGASFERAGGAALAKLRLGFEGWTPHPVNIAQSLAIIGVRSGLWFGCSKSCAGLALENGRADGVHEWGRERSY